MVQEYRILDENMPSPPFPAKGAASKIWDYINGLFNKDNWFGRVVTPLLIYTYSHAKGAASKIWDYVNGLFDKDNWFGSVVTPLLIYTYYQSMMAGRTRVINGVPSPDRKREISAQLFIAEKTWSFFAARGGKFPEGETAWQRIVNTLKHPQLSAKQFEYLLIVPILGLNIYGSMLSGLKAHGIGLKSGELSYKTEKIRLYLALAHIVSVVLMAMGHFRTHKRESVIALTSDIALSGTSVNTGPKFFHVVKKIWKYDRILLIGSAINAILPGFVAVEGWLKSGKSIAEASHLAKGAIVSSLINTAYTIYTFQRIVKSNYGENKPAQDNSIKPQDKIKDQRISEEENGSTKFTKRLAEKSRSTIEITR